MEQEILTIEQKEQIYQNAQILVSGGLYWEAATEFARIPGYKDASEQITACEERFDASRMDAIYADADKAAANENVKSQQKAISLFQRIPGWRDADERIIRAQKHIEELLIKERTDREEAIRRAEALRIRRKRRRTIIAIVSALLAVLIAVAIVGKIHYGKFTVPKLRYEQAQALMEAGDTEAAYRIFRDLDYGDNEETMFRIAKDRLGTVEVGSTVQFGTYEQDNNRSNGPEFIEWLVIDQDGSKRMLISKYALDSRAYQEFFAEQGCTWGTSSIRAWLNDAFMNQAFSRGEQRLISRTSVTPDENPYYRCSNGSTVRDKVYLLSIPEVEHYFPEAEDHLCLPTRYASAHAVYVSSAGNYCWWWLRTLGDDVDFYRATGVGTNGEIVYIGHYIYNNGYAIRPVLWIDLDAEWSDGIPLLK